MEQNARERRAQLRAASRAADATMTDRGEHHKLMMAKRKAGRFFGPGFLAGLLIGGAVCFLAPGAPAAVVLAALPFVTAGLAYDWRLKRLIRDQRMAVAN